MRLRIIALVTAALLAPAGLAPSVHAQTLEDRLRSQLVAVTAQLRQAQAAQGELQAKAAAADKARDEASARLAHAEGELRSGRRAARSADPGQAAALARAQAEAQQLAASGVQAKGELDALRADNARLSGEAEQLRGEHDRLAAALGAGEQTLSACQAKNAAALAVARDILAAYGRVGLGGVIARKEPFTRLKRVEIERLAQAYGDRIYDSRVDAAPRPAPIPASAATAPATAPAPHP